jgi:hypothetical protein
LSGEEGIGKTTLIEAIATEFDCCVIHFPINHFSDKMIYSFFKTINNLSTTNIIVFDNFNFELIKKYNSNLYNLLSEFIIKNDKKNIFIFTFNELNNIPYTFSSNYHIHYHYHMDAHINNILNFVKDNLNEWSENELDYSKLEDIKNKFLILNHKITPGYIIPYLILNEDFKKSLDRFFRVIKN